MSMSHWNIVSQATLKISLLYSGMTLFVSAITEVQ
jgi:hypothetical protein